MAGHRAQVINYEVRADATIVVTARCCGDKLTDSNHTEHDLDAIDANIDAHLARIETLHEKRLAAEEKVKQRLAASGR
jgi:hypothetical protein